MDTTIAVSPRVWILNSHLTAGTDLIVRSADIFNQKIILHTARCIHHDSNSLSLLATSTDCDTQYSILHCNLISILCEQDDQYTINKDGV